MAVTGKTFRIFVSSTFDDMCAERNALQREVWPKLRTLCEKHGARFQAIDLRWGISNEATQDQRTVAICLTEVRRCLQVTARPNMVVLLGQRYGWRPLPYEIQQDHFEIVHGSAPPDIQVLLDEWYWLDENAIPPVYVLRPVSNATETAWKDAQPTLRTYLDEAFRALSLSEVTLRYYTASVAEQEIQAGVFEDEIELHDSAFCFFRELAEIPEEHQRRYLAPESDAERLARIKQNLRDTLPDKNICEYTPAFDELDDEVLTPYQKQLCNDVYEKLAAAIVTELEEEGYIDRLDTEVERHQAFTEERTQHFIGRTEVLDRIARYLMRSARHPLVVHGESGVGKTAVMGRAVQQAQGNHLQAEIVYRFIGATPEASNQFTLLDSLCRQISRCYRADYRPSNNFSEVAAQFGELITQASADRPLIILLDALDQLADLGEDSGLSWLPIELPKHTSLVVSTLPGHILKSLRKTLDPNRLLKVEPMPLAQGRVLLYDWLADVSRTLTEDQEKEVLAKFDNNGKPLYLRLAFEEAQLWRSYDKDFALSPDIRGIICDNLFVRLSQKANHGPLLVAKALGYLAAAKNGLTEDELLDLLARDNEYWRDFTADAHWETVSRRVPVVLWSRLHFDLRPYLTERAADGTLLMSFYHRQLAQAAKAAYLAQDKQVPFHSQLADYFASQPLYQDDAFRRNPNRRKLSELSNHYAQAGRHNELCELLTASSAWMGAHFTVAGSDRVYAGEIEFALSQYRDTIAARDLLTVLKLLAAQQVVISRAGALTDDVLATLALMGREDEALTHNAMRNNLPDQVRGLLAIHQALQFSGTPNPDLIDQLLKMASRIEALQQPSVLQEVATRLEQAGDPRARDVLDAALDATRNLRYNESYDEWHLDVQYNIDQLTRELEEALAKFPSKSVARLSDAMSDQTINDTELITLEEVRAHPGQYSIDRLTKVTQALAVAGDSQVGELLEEVIARCLQNVSSTTDYDVSELLREQARRVLDRISIRFDTEERAISPDQMLEEARHAGDRDQHVRLLIKAAEMLDSADDSRAADVFEEVLSEASRTEEGSTRFEGQQAVVEFLVRRGQFEKTRQIAQDVEPSWPCGDELLCKVAVALAQAGQIEEARDLAEYLVDDPSRAKALSEVAVTLTEAGQEDEALDLFDTVIEAVGELAYDAYDYGEGEAWVAALTAVGQALVRVGDDGRLYDLFRMAIEAARNREDIPYGDFWEERAELERRVILAFARLDDGNFIGSALDAAREIEEEEHRLETLREVAGVMVELGDYEWALEEARTIAGSELWWREWAIVEVYADIARQWAQSRDFRKALTALDPTSLDALLRALCDWATFLEPDLALGILQEVCRIGGWMRSDLREVFELLHGAEATMPKEAADPSSAS